MKKNPKVRRSFFAALCVAILLFLFFILSTRADPPARTSEKPYHFIRAIAIDPVASEIIYVATENQGLIKSVDGGKHWRFINDGVKTRLIYDVKVSLVTPNRIYAAAWGAGFYQSDDDGASWREANDGLGNTAVGVIALQPDRGNDGEKIFIGTSTDLYERRGKEGDWRSITEGLLFWNGPQFQSLAAELNPPLLWMGTEQGLYKRSPGTPGWTEVGAMKGKKVTALMSLPAASLLYAGTVSPGGIYLSRNEGADWASLGAGLETAWIRAVAAHPSDPKIVYAAAGGLGILKSRDGGGSWEKVNIGLSDLDIRALAVDPKNPNVLYAGARGEGIFKSAGAGGAWKPLGGLPYESRDRQLIALDSQSKKKDLKPAPPAAFKKCNQCHGWTDPDLNQKPTSWRVAANRRDWRKTVARMSEGTDILPGEREEIAAFLQNDTEKK